MDTQIDFEKIRTHIKAYSEKSKELVRTLERVGELIVELNEMEVMLSGDSGSDGGDCCNSNGSCDHTCRTGN